MWRDAAGAGGEARRRAAGGGRAPAAGPAARDIHQDSRPPRGCGAGRALAQVALCEGVARGCGLTAAVGLQAAEAGPGRTRGAGRRGDSSGRVGAAVSTSPPLERGVDAKEALVVPNDVRSPPLAPPAPEDSQ